jgi:hypothetical protein
MGSQDSLRQMNEKNAVDEGENRGKQILVGGLILLAISTVTVTFLMGWRFIPGWVGESFGTLAGVMSTPFLMEGSFFMLGVVIVIGLNAWRRHKEGDEFVAIELKDTKSSNE